MLRGLSCQPRPVSLIRTQRRALEANTRVDEDDLDEEENVISTRRSSVRNFVFLRIRLLIVIYDQRNQASTSTKGKGKQKEVIPATDDEALSDKSLEYDEVEESDASGSEFQASDAEDSDIEIVSTARKLANKARAASPEMDEAEGEMVEAAIQESLRSTRAAAKSGARSSKFVSLSDAEVSSVQELSDISDSEDDEPVVKKGKGKGKSKAGDSSSISYQAPKIMDLKELKKQKRLERQAKAPARKLLKQQERALAKDLGRALIQVCSNTRRFHAHLMFDSAVREECSPTSQGAS
jgi:hypothetical protein